MTSCPQLEQKKSDKLSNQLNNMLVIVLLSVVAVATALRMPALNGNLFYYLF
jgi:hypothetical protein